MLYKHSLKMHRFNCKEKPRSLRGAAAEHVLCAIEAPRHPMHRNTRNASRILPALRALTATAAEADADATREPFEEMASHTPPPPRDHQSQSHMRQYSHCDSRSDTNALLLHTSLDVNARRHDDVSISTTTQTHTMRTWRPADMANGFPRAARELEPVPHPPPPPLLPLPQTLPPPPLHSSVSASVSLPDLNTSDAQRAQLVPFPIWAPAQPSPPAPAQMSYFMPPPQLSCASGPELYSAPDASCWQANQCGYGPFFPADPYAPGLYPIPTSVLSGPLAPAPAVVLTDTATATDAPFYSYVPTLQPQLQVQPLINFAGQPFPSGTALGSSSGVFYPQPPHFPVPQAAPALPICTSTLIPAPLAAYMEPQQLPQYYQPLLKGALTALAPQPRLQAQPLSQPQPQLGAASWPAAAAFYGCGGVPSGPPFGPAAPIRLPLPLPVPHPLLSLRPLQLGPTPTQTAAAAAFMPLPNPTLRPHMSFCLPAAAPAFAPSQCQCASSMPVSAHSFKQQNLMPPLPLPLPMQTQTVSSAFSGGLHLLLKPVDAPAAPAAVVPAPAVNVNGGKVDVAIGGTQSVCKLRVQSVPRTMNGHD